MPAGVVGDDSVTGALKRCRPHDDVAPSRRQAVQQDDRWTLAVLFSRELHPVSLDVELGHGSCLPDRARPCFKHGYHEIRMDVTESNFQTAVLERSSTVPVVVDFWAEWCGPCRQLGPVLERAVQARAGKVELAKLDVDSNPTLSRTYGIQSIPAVKAFRDGKVVSEFVGAQPPVAVERFLDQLAPSEVDELVARGDE